MSILVTRPNPEGQKLVNQLHSIGLQAWSMPLITFHPSEELKYLIGRLRRLNDGDYVFLLSRWSIRYAHPTLLAYGERNWPENLIYYAVGSSTASEFYEASSYSAKYPKNKESSEGLINLVSPQEMRDKNVLVLCGSNSRMLLARTLVYLGAIVTFSECYKYHLIPYDGSIEGYRWRDIGIKTLVVTSSMILMQLFRLFPIQHREEWLLGCELVVISQRLATIAKSLGWKKIYIAAGASNESLLHSLQLYERSRVSYL